MSFIQKLLQCSITMANGVFDGGQNSATIQTTGGLNATDLRMSASITVTGSSIPGIMDLAIYGLPLSLMNQLSTVGTNYLRRLKNTISLSAGEVGGQFNLVFQGLIEIAFVDAAAQPQVCLRIHATPNGSYFSVKPVPPISKQGAQPASDMISSIAGQMGLKFENMASMPSL
jgi:hypothetical protein